MQRIVSKLTGYSIGAKDGEIGSVEDLLFDDKLSTVRYLVADIAKWLPGRRVVLSPMALGRVEEDEKRLRVSLTKEQVENSPDVDSKNFSRQRERSYNDYYGWQIIGWAEMYGVGQRRRLAWRLRSGWKWRSWNKKMMMRHICAAPRR